MKKISQTLKMGNARGTVFVTTMVTMFIMALTGAYFFDMSSHGMAYVKRIEHSAQSKYLADAALARIYSTVTSAAPTGASFSNQSLGPGTYTASISTVSGQYLATGTGNVLGVSRTATAEIIPPGISALNYLFTAGSSLSFSSTGGGASTNITGNSLSPSGATFTGIINRTGIDYTGTPSFPVVDTSFYQSIASANGYYFNGDKTYANGTIPAAPAGGVIYVNGNLTLLGVQTTTACIIATGNILMDKVGGIQPAITINQFSNYPAMMTVNGSITHSCNGSSGSFIVTGLVYSGNNLTFTQNHTTLTVNGSILAKGAMSFAYTSNAVSNLSYVAQDPPGFSNPGASISIASYNS